jgi:branched-chain amino acid transport system substrate-binding protein
MARTLVIVATLLPLRGLATPVHDNSEPCSRSGAIVRCPPGAAIPVAALLGFENPGLTIVVGQNELRGAQIAIELHGRVAGHPVRLARYDNGCFGPVDADVATIAASAYVAVLGPSCSGAALSVAGPLADAGLSTISPSATKPILTDPALHAAGFLRVSSSDAVQGELLGGYARTQLGLDRAAIVREDDAFVDAIAQAFADAFGPGVVLDEPLPCSGASCDPAELAPLVARIAATNPDIVFLPVATLPLELAQAVTAALPGVPLATIDADDFLPDALGAAGDGMYVSEREDRFRGALYDAFADRFLAEHGSSPGLFASNGFDAMSLILDAMERVARDDAGWVSVDLAALRAALYATHGLAGILEPIDCAPSGDCARGGIRILRSNLGRRTDVFPDVAAATCVRAVDFASKWSNPCAGSCACESGHSETSPFECGIGEFCCYGIGQTGCAASGSDAACCEQNGTDVGVCQDDRCCIDDFLYGCTADAECCHATCVAGVCQP